MNRLTIIGNLTGDPELRTTPAGKSVCNFTVAVNRQRKIEGQPDADFFRVSTWDAMAENCSKYLAKGRKVAVIGPVSVRTYETQNGKHGASLEVTAREVEFLSSRNEPQESKPAEQPKVDQQTGMPEVDADDLPF